LDRIIFDEILPVRLDIESAKMDKKYDFSMTKLGTDPGSGSRDLCNREEDSVVFIRALCAVLPSLQNSTLIGLLKRGLEESSGVWVKGCVAGTSAVRETVGKDAEGIRGQHLHLKGGLSSSTTGVVGRGDLGGKGAEDKSLVRLVVRSVCVGFSCLERKRKQAAAVLGTSDTRNSSDSDSAGAGVPFPSMTVDQDGGGGRVGSTDRGEEEVRIFVQSAADIIITLVRSESKELKTVNTEKYATASLTEAIEEVTRVLQSRGSTSSTFEIVFAQRVCAAELLTAVVQGLLLAQGVSGGEPCVWYVFVSVCQCVIFCMVYECYTFVWCMCTCVCVSVCACCVCCVFPALRERHPYGSYVLVDVNTI
jgi:hypothetical protein